jgi:4-azaleucine resistance transporter AzlC
VDAVSYSRAGFLRGLRASPPLVLGMLPFGSVAGLTAQAHGLSLAEAALMSLLVFAGSSQLLALAAWAQPVPVLSASLTSLTVNLRFMLMSPLLAPWLDGLRGWRRWGTLFFLTDNVWATSLKAMNAGERDAAFLLGAGLPLWVGWWLTAIAGHVAGTLLAPTPGHPVFFAAMAVFVALLVSMWRGAGDLLPWLVAAAIALAVSKALPGTSWHIVVAAIGGALAGLCRDRWRRRSA